LPRWQFDPEFASAAVPGAVSRGTAACFGKPLHQGETDTGALRLCGVKQFEKMFLSIRRNATSSVKNTKPYGGTIVHAIKFGQPARFGERVPCIANQVVQHLGQKIRIRNDRYIRFRPVGNSQ